MDAIKVLDNAIAQISALQNTSIYQPDDVARYGNNIKGIALNALKQINASQATMQNLYSISFSSSYTSGISHKAFGIEGMRSGLIDTYLTGLKAVIALLKQERDIRAENINNDRQIKALKHSRIAITVSIISLIVSILVALLK